MEIRLYRHGKLWQIIIYGDAGVRAILNPIHPRVKRERN